MKRRTFLKGSLAAGVTGAAVGSGLLAPNMAFAGEAAGNAYEATSIEDALKVLGITTEDSDKVEVVAPDLAENAAVVPVEVKTTL
ncbi:MAG: twin-arginine translocation signal domain-containing protein, partial [Cocleimonas sp.]|nr:twin-arginine translocation signal domain-containing protein [Cocleimonas sp.]